MTLGFVQREMRALDDRVKVLESKRGGFSEEQIGLIAKTYADRAFRRLIIWVMLAAFFGGGLVWALR